MTIQIYSIDNMIHNLSSQLGGCYEVLYYKRSGKISLNFLILIHLQILLSFILPTIMPFFKSLKITELNSDVFTSLKDVTFDDSKPFLGHGMWLQCEVTPIRNEQTVIVLFLCTFRDITAFKEPLEGTTVIKNLSKFAKLAWTMTKSRQTQAAGDPSSNNHLGVTGNFGIQVISILLEYLTLENKVFWICTEY